MGDQSSEHRTVAELGDWLGGSTPSKDIRAFWKPPYLPWVSPKDMASDRISGSEDWVSRLGASRLHIFPAGATAVVFRSGILRHKLPVALAARSFTVNQDLKAVSSAGDVSPDYAFHCLQGIAEQIVQNGVKSGTTVESIDSSTFFSTRVFVPQMPEQRRIAEILDTVDDAIRRTEQIINKLEQVKQGLLHDLLTRGIDDNGELRDPVSHPELFKDSPLGRIPRDWVICRASEIATLITKGESPNWQGFSYQESGVVFVTSENVRSGWLDISSPKFIPQEFHRKLSRSSLRRDDVLLNLVGASIGRSCQVPELKGAGNINQAVCLLRTKTPVESSWIASVLDHPAAMNRLIGEQVETARANISLGDVRRFLLPMPRLNELRQACSLLELEREKLSTNSTSLTKLRFLKKGLMDDLLTGRVRVTPLLDAESSP